MPYTTNLFLDIPSLNKAASRLSAENDADAIVEAERLLRSSRVVAGAKGERPPTAGVVYKDGQEFVCVIVNPPIPEDLPGAEYWDS